MTLKMCEHYGCTPSQLAQEDYAIVMTHYQLLAGEAKGIRGTSK